MPAFSYEAVDEAGRRAQGMVEAESARAARSLLRGRGLVPLAVNTVAEASGDRAPGLLARELWSRRILGPARLAVMTRQLAGLVEAGLPLERALTVLADESDAPRQGTLLSALRAEVNAGASFAKALAQFPREFSDTYRAVVAAGEQGGRLAGVLNRLAHDLEESLALQSKLLGAALYPALVSLIALGIVVFLLAYVVPQVAEVFTGSKRALPALTVAMLWLSQAVRSSGLFLALGAAVMAGLAGLALRRAEMRQRFDALWLRLPLVGRLARSYNAARFGATLAMLTGAGVPMLKALQASADTLGNRAMQADARQALVLVREGAPLASALGTQGRFPALLVMFIRLGEQTGTLPEMLQRAAQQLSSEVQRRAFQLATLLEPLLIVGMGGMVMLIVLAVLLPIIELNQLVR